MTSKQDFEKLVELITSGRAEYEDPEFRQIVHSTFKRMMEDGLMGVGLSYHQLVKDNIEHSVREDLYSQGLSIFKSAVIADYALQCFEDIKEEHPDVKIFLLTLVSAMYERTFRAIPELKKLARTTVEDLESRGIWKPEAPNA